MRLDMTDYHLIDLLNPLPCLHVNRLSIRVCHLRLLHHLHVRRMLSIARMDLGMSHMILLGQDFSRDQLQEPVILQLRRPLRFDVNVLLHQLLNVNNVKSIRHRLVQLHLIEIRTIGSSIKKRQEAVLLELLVKRLRRTHSGMDTEVPEEVTIP